MFIYRDEVYHEEKRTKALPKLLLVNNETAIGRVRLCFMGQYSRFDNYADSSFE